MRCWFEKIVVVGGRRKRAGRHPALASNATLPQSPHIALPATHHSKKLTFTLPATLRFRLMLWDGIAHGKIKKSFFEGTPVSCKLFGRPTKVYKKHIKMSNHWLSDNQSANPLRNKFWPYKDQMKHWWQHWLRSLATDFVRDGAYHLSGQRRTY